MKSVALFIAMKLLASLEKEIVLTVLKKKT